MGKSLKIVLASVLGIIIGLFGVLVSVFADGPLNERIITFVVVLLIYGLLGATFGYLESSLSWKWGVIIGTPGILALLIYFFKEPHSFFLSVFYVILILVTACSGAYFSSNYKS